MEASIKNSVFLSDCVSAAALDLHIDFGAFERRGMSWGARAIQEWDNNIFRTGKRRAIIKVNQALNSAAIDCDMVEVLFVGRINKYTGEKVPFHINRKLVSLEDIETIPEDLICEAKCTGCLPKAICNDLQSTIVLRAVDINGTSYDETKTSTLTPDGTYYVVTETPYYSNINSQVEYLTKKEVLASLDVEACGCIKDTPANISIVKDCNFDCYCTYCSPVCSEFENIGYNIFPETNTIKFDKNFREDEFYMEWRGGLPKIDGQYIAPALAKESLIEYIKFKSIQNKKGVPRYTVQDQYEWYLIKKNNMEMAMGAFSLSDFIYGLTATSKFDYHV